MMELSLLKQYLRIDGNHDDELLTFLLVAAQDYIKGALENKDIQNDPRFDYATALLVAHYYDNREVIGVGGAEEAPLGVLSLIQQLRGV